MAKPPTTPPHSDLDGVREDERNTVRAANASGQGAADLERARANSSGRPRQGEEKSGRDRGRDDRSA